MTNYSASRPHTLALGKTRAYRRNTFSAPTFGCDIPEDPLHAAASPDAMLEAPVRIDDDEPVYSLLDFSRRRVSSIEPRQSTLTAALENAASRPNPFNEAVAAGGDAEGPYTVRVRFPHAQSSAAWLMELHVPVNSTVEDVIARALFAYWNQNLLPLLESEREVNVGEWIALVPGRNGVVEKRIACHLISHYRKYDMVTIVRKPTTYLEKQNIQQQVAQLDLRSGQSKPRALTLKKNRP